MSLYTTTVREIFHAMTAPNPIPTNDYNIMERGIPLLFDRQIGTDNDFWNILTHGIIRHFWVDEIGQETPDLWKWYLYDTIENKYEKWYNLFNGWKRDNQHFFDNLSTEKEIHEREQSTTNNSITSNQSSNSNNTVTDHTGTIKNDGSNTMARSDTGTVKNDNIIKNTTSSSSDNTTSSQSTELDENRVNDTPQTIITVGNENQYLTSYTQRDHTMSVAGTDKGTSSGSNDTTETKTETRNLQSSENGSNTNTETLNTKDTSNSSGSNTDSGKKEDNGSLNEDITITRNHSNVADYSALIEKLNLSVPWLEVVYNDCSDLFMLIM